MLPSFRGNPITRHAANQKKPVFLVGNVDAADGSDSNRASRPGHGQPGTGGAQDRRGPGQAGPRTWGRTAGNRGTRVAEPRFRFDQLVLFAAILCVALLVFVPLLVIHVYVSEEAPAPGRGTSETAVGIGVVLRATIRRWFRFGSRKLLRTTIATYSRASARAFTRRVVKTAGRVILGSLVKGRNLPLLTASDQPESSDQAAAPTRTDTGHRFSLLLGCVALSASFLGVLLAQTPDDLAQVTGSGALTLLSASLIAGVPLVVYAVALRAAARLNGGQVHFQTALDGLLLQGYFTGAGSFLPLTTDVQYGGDRSKHHRIAACGLAALYLCHLTFGIAGALSGIYVFQFASAMFLTYCFVFSFPIFPLDGYHLWERSRWLWLACWLPIMVSFIFALPPSFAILL